MPRDARTPPPAADCPPPEPTGRFSDRVDDYVAYRPDYPRAVLDVLARECGLGPSSAVADVGSGTGKLTELLLERARTVYAVEPNAPMRAAAERLLAGRPGFASIDGRAEATGLPSGSVDLVTAAQAFHWFDPEPTRAEFRRILKPGGLVALAWNERVPEDSPYLAEYEQLLREYSVDYGRVDHRRVSSPDAVAAFFRSSALHEAEFPNPRELSLEALQGGYCSASYALTRDHPRYPEAMARLEELFQRHQRGGRVTHLLRCRLYWGAP